MHDLSKLIEYLSDFKYLSKALSKGSITSQLYQLIKDGKIKTDKEAKSNLWPDGAPRGALGYVKRNLESKVIDAVLLQSKDHGKVSSANKDIAKRIAAFRLMKANGKALLGRHIIESCLDKAFEYEFYEYAYDILRELIWPAAMSGDKKYKQYSKELSRVQLIVKKEQQINDLINLVNFTLSGKTSISADDIHKITEIKAQACQIPDLSTRITYTKGLIEVYNAIVSEKHQFLYQICQRYLNTLVDKWEIVPVGVLFTFINKSIPYLITSNQTSKAWDLIGQAELLTQSHSYNWHVINQYKVICLFYEKKWQEAYRICQQVIDVAKMNIEQKELWPIYSAYAAILSGQPTKTHKLMNDVSEYKHDKLGMQFSLIVLELIHYLNKKDYGKYIDRIPALKRYAYRYLNKPATKRQWYFAKALLQLEDTRFDGKNLAVANSLIEKMEEYPISTNFELEFVPYGVLWEEVTGWITQA